MILQPTYLTATCTEVSASAGVDMLSGSEHYLRQSRML